MEMCFDENGIGEKHLVLTDAVECEGEVWATYLESGMLQLNDRQDIYCTDGSYVYRGIADCDTGSARLKRPAQGEIQGSKERRIEATGSGV